MFITTQYGASAGGVSPSQIWPAGFPERPQAVPASFESFGEFLGMVNAEQVVSYPAAAGTIARVATWAPGLHRI